MFVFLTTIATNEASTAKGEPAPEAVVSQAPASDTWAVPDVNKLSNDAWGKMVRLGRELTVATSAHLGPEAVDPTKRYAGSNLSCQSCHLEAGTKKFGLPFVGVFADFPQYRAREAEVGTLEDRINGCVPSGVAELARLQAMGFVYVHL